MDSRVVVEGFRRSFEPGLLEPCPELLFRGLLVEHARRVAAA